jgi:HemY protein
MRRLLTFIVLAVVIGGAMGTLMSRDPGYVLITFADMSFETSLWFALLALIVIYFLLRLGIAVWTRLLRSGAGVANWRQDRRARTAQTNTVRGFVLVGEGDWAGGRKALLGAAQDAAMPLINYVGAAHAANRVGDVGERDRWLDKAAESTPEAALAIALTRAEMQFATQQYPSARATLEQAKLNAPDHPRLLRLMADTLEQMGDWPALIKLAPELRKRAVYDADALRASLRRWWIGCFDRPVTVGVDATRELAAQWSNVDKDLQSDPELIAAYVHALANAGAVDEAESTLSKVLKQDWNEGLVALYGRLRMDPGDRQLATAQGWLKQHPNDATLLLALGRIASANRDNAKAREYFEASLKAQPTAEVSAELGRLYLATDERARASELLAQALTLGGEVEESPLRSAAPGKTSGSVVARS